MFLIFVILSLFLLLMLIDRRAKSHPATILVCMALTSLVFAKYIQALLIRV